MTEEKLIRKLEAGEITLDKIPEKHRTYKVCLVGCREALQFVPDKHKTWELCKKAVYLNSSNIRYIPNRHKTREFYLDVIGEVSYAYIGYTCGYIAKEIKTYDFYLEIAKRNIIVLRDVPREYRTYELYYELAKNNKDKLQIKFISDFIPIEYLFRYNPIITYLRWSKLTSFSFQCREKKHVNLSVYDGWNGWTGVVFIKPNFLTEYTKIFLFIKN